MADEGQEMMTKLREEVESPFRKVRFALYIAGAAGAAVSGLVALTQTIAALSGINVELLPEASRNLAIDVAAIAVIAFLWRRDLISQNSRYERISQGAKLAALGLQLQMADDSNVVSLADLRRRRGREKRVAIVLGGKEAVQRSLDSAVPVSSELLANDLLVVPLVIGQTGDELNAERITDGPRIATLFNLQSDLESREGQPHVALPFGFNQWIDTLQSELVTAEKQKLNPIDDGLLIVIKKNGRVGTRKVGAPIWSSLIQDVERRREAGLDVVNI
ncbi:unnamed protein product [Vitrella brassicaformis CCMP3155]|uniref:Uncharacterized protein n=2 Tax=Vitrella brassicaformis TaxID=1169539 RepID=A0A0G4E9P3_VITBC|nr:unnamed protein product [Vitrella brassicaformis CCMP3155]|eukprot:CEL92366.1 unnamed protein product [Vitrella brassicaformis CCMP3155]